jgi:hypothetical protein
MVLKTADNLKQHMASHSKSFIADEPASAALVSDVTDSDEALAASGVPRSRTPPRMDPKSQFADSSQHEGGAMSLLSLGWKILQGGGATTPTAAAAADGRIQLFSGVVRRAPYN